MVYASWTPIEHSHVSPLGTAEGQRIQGQPPPHLCESNLYLFFIQKQFYSKKKEIVLFYKKYAKLVRENEEQDCLAEAGPSVFVSTFASTVARHYASGVRYLPSVCSFSPGRPPHHTPYNLLISQLITSFLIFLFPFLLYPFFPIYLISDKSHLDSCQGCFSTPATWSQISLGNTFPIWSSPQSLQA